MEKSLLLYELESLCSCSEFSFSVFMNGPPDILFLAPVNQRFVRSFLVFLQLTSDISSEAALRFLKCDLTETLTPEQRLKDVEEKLLDLDQKWKHQVPMLSRNLSRRVTVRGLAMSHSYRPVAGCPAHIPT